MKSANGTVLEHRMVVARRIGRPLWREEIVHHLNGVRTDNRDENLELLTTKREHHCAHGDVYYEKWQHAEQEVAKLRADLSTHRRVPPG